MKYLMLLVAFLLAGCMTTEERIAAQNAKDNQKCLGYGAQVGSRAYVNCRAQLDAARTTADAIEDAAPAPTINSAPIGSTATIQPVTIPQTRWCQTHNC
jgi:hypothetical protein